MIQITIETQRGPASVQAIDHGAHWQYNCFLPPCGGAGIFAMMRADLSSDECSDTMRALIESGPHAENMDLTSTHGNLEAAGTVNMAQINVSEAIRSQRSATQQFERKPCPECQLATGDAVAPALTLEDYHRALSELDKREGLTDELRQTIRNRMEEVILPALSPV